MDNLVSKAFVRMCVCVCVCVCLVLFSGVTLAHEQEATEHGKGRDYARTRYPIVLVHGMAGFDKILGVDYFYGIPADLRANGATVLLADVSAFNDNAVRGEQLLKQLQTWTAAYGYRKFNLIGHSQGGPTARYVAGVAPELVASISMVGSPNVLPAGNNPLGGILTNYASIVSLFGNIEAFLGGHVGLPQDPAALLSWASNTPEFNTRFPLGAPTTPCGQGPEVDQGIYFYSVAGNKINTNLFDLSDYILDLAMQGSTDPSDGLVPVCAAHWGKVLRDDYPWNHIDEMNHIFGLIGWSAPDPVAFYRAQANRLKHKGL